VSETPADRFARLLRRQAFVRAAAEQYLIGAVCAALVAVVLGAVGIGAAVDGGGALALPCLLVAVAAAWLALRCLRGARMLGRLARDRERLLQGSLREAVPSLRRVLLDSGSPGDG
jgi:hypothetical protein